MKTFLLLFCFLSYSSIAHSSESLRFIVNYPGSAPYLYFDEVSGTYKGVIPDVFKELIDNEIIQIKYISNSRKRSEENMYRGVADMAMLSKYWVRQPDKLIFTTPLHQHRSFLYRSEPFTEKFSLDDSLGQERLCTRKGFVYPNLSEFINNGRLIRTDSSNQLSMLKMLIKGRCDLVVMNEFNAQNLMSSSFFSDNVLYRTIAPISIVPLNIVLRKSLVAEQLVLNKHIEKLKKNGDIQRFIAHHMGNKNAKIKTGS